ncbi:hypothetical protein [Candidatus Hecatella orcuttiae]|uniref:hypothetical protein n=1 Tax=Candidatus Hecatella orcuttiae TaxID=1935119 RepID=UPI0028681A77|nr:hypothetical protein [Candidatus Hecatella orcuttiae]
MRSDLLHKVIEISNRRGTTVYGFVNEIFEQAIKADELNATPTQVVEYYSLMETMKKAGAVIITLDILNHCIEKLSRIDKDLSKKWYTSGLWYGKYLSAKFQDPLETLKKILTTCFWEITEVELIQKDEENLTLRVLAPNHTEVHTELLLRFVEGIVNSLDYKVQREEHWKGIILLDLQKRIMPADMELEIETI